jgi:predicted RNA-binding protein YlxR (DUF448 family)/ribosomal protein L7Ae-like RNA K-turn-binding protein
VLDQSRLVRYVRAPDGALLVDYRHKLPGRGAYTCLNFACICQAVSRKQFERALRATCPAVITAEALRDQLLVALHDRLAALLGMARKSSQVVSGGNQVLAALDQPDRLALVVFADDVSAGVADKVASKAGRQMVPCLSFSTKAALGQLLGRGERSVTGLMKGHLAEAFLGEWQKFQEISGES